MTLTEFQQWLNAHGAVIDADGKPGPETRGAVPHVFSNVCAAAVTPSEIETFSTRLGVTSKQTRAVSIVESGGASFDAMGRPKMLFERHKFHTATGGQFSVSPFSNPKGGGYSEDSWDKLARAACKDVEGAFASASWGRFQVLGSHYAALEYESALALAYSTVTSEAAHYELLARFIEKNDLKDEMKRLSTNPDDCRPFARAYNGARYEDFDYHNKLARAMR